METCKALVFSRRDNLPEKTIAVLTKEVAGRLMMDSYKTTDIGTTATLKHTCLDDVGMLAATAIREGCDAFIYPEGAIPNLASRFMLAVLSWGRPLPFVYEWRGGYENPQLVRMILSTQAVEERG